VNLTRSKMVRNGGESFEVGWVIHTEDSTHLDSPAMIIRFDYLSVITCFSIFLLQNQPDFCFRQQKNDLSHTSSVKLNKIFVVLSSSFYADFTARV